MSGRVGLMRFAANGQIDTSFGTGGYAVAPNTSFGEAGTRMDIASDGRVVVAGYSYTTETGDLDFIITRFMPDGLVDASFGTGGRVSTNFASLNDRGYDVKVMPDGRIVAAGMAGFDHWSGRDNFAAVRYLVNGQSDTAFGFGGRAYYEIGGYLDNVEAMYLEANGDLMLLGSSFDQDKMAYDVALARIRVDGNFDRSFGQSYAIKREGMPDVLIGTQASVSDPDVAGGNFNGHQLTIQRKGGAVPAEDGFWFAGNRVNASAPVMVLGVGIGTMSVMDGVLRITLNEQATPDLVRGMLSTISYARSSASASGSVQLAWRWTDEAGAVADAESKVVFSDDYADVGDPRIDTTNLSVTNHWKLAGTSLYFNGANLYMNASARQMYTWKMSLTQTFPTGEIYGVLDTYVNTQVKMRMLTVSEAVSLQSLPNRPAAYQTGIFWTSTKDPANGLRYYTINMATGAVAPALETSRYPLLVMVSN